MKLRHIDNPPNPYSTEHAEWLEPPPLARLEVYEETASSILSKNNSPDLSYNWSLNPYRGCQHACAYCYARPYHEYLGFGAGTDFETKLVVKLNAAQLLRKALMKRTWKRERINFSGATDCYQPLEASYRITRDCLQICAEFANPVTVVTKAFLIVRDADVLAELTRVAGVRVFMSIPFASAKTCSLMEPQAPPPARRFEALRRLREAGVDVGVFIAPLIPGLNDKDIPKILEQAAEAGATSASMTALRLPGSVESIFLKRLKEVMPQRAKRIVNRIRDIRGGRMTDSRFGNRMRGSGPYWESVRRLFEITRKKYGLDGKVEPAPPLETPPPLPPLRAAGCGSQGRMGAAGNTVQLAFDFARHA